MSQTEHAVVGKTARVTGRVSQSETGEVQIAVRGGMETFFAFPEHPGETFEIGTVVQVTAYEPPRTVRVTATLS